MMSTISRVQLRKPVPDLDQWSNQCPVDKQEEHIGLHTNTEMMVIR